MAINLDPSSAGDARLLISILGDASGFVEEVQKAKEGAATSLQSLQQDFGKLFEGANADVQKWGTNLITTAQATGKSVSEAFTILQKEGLIGAQMDEATEALKRLGGAATSSGEDAKTAAGGFKALAAAGLKIVGIIGAFQILRQILRGVANVIKESIEEYKAYTFEVFRLDVGVRAMQRRMGEAAGTTDEWRGYIQELREQFGIFSTRDLTAATSRVVLLTRELRFNQEQVKQVIQASIILAETMGVKVEEAARRLTLFLDTGYSRGLAALGLQISRVTVQEEAHRQGIEKSWNEMSRAERASVSLIAVNKQLEAQVDDAGRAVETFAGRMMEMEAAQSDAMLEIGKSSRFAATFGAFMKTFFITEVFPFMLRGIDAIGKMWITAVAGGMALWVAFGVTAAKALTLVKDHSKEALESFMNFQETVDLTKEAFDAIVVSMTEDFLPALSEMGDVTEEEMASMVDEAEKIQDAMQNVADAYQKGVEQIEDELQNLEDAQADAFSRMTDRLEDQARRFGDRIKDLLRDFQDRLRDIDADFGRKRQKLIEDYARKEVEVTEKMNEDIAEAEEEFRLNELQAQREFNLETERLKREYLFSLEDAIRERDARQILMLMRRFNLDKAGRQEDYEEQKRQREEDLELEIQQIRRRAVLRRAELRRELAQRLEDLRTERAREKIEAKRDFLDRLEDLRLQNERRREEIELDYQRRLRDLKIHHIRRLQEIGRALVKEYGFNAVIALRLTALWSQYFRNIVTAYQVMRGMLSETGPTSLPGVATDPDLRIERNLDRGFAKGGGVIANKPTTARFGEAGPELGSFIPLNRLGEVMGGGQQRIGLDITVKPDARLIVEVAEGVMSEIADVVVQTEREM